MAPECGGAAPSKLTVEAHRCARRFRRATHTVLPGALRGNSSVKAAYHGPAADRTTQALGRILVGASSTLFALVSVTELLIVLPEIHVSQSTRYCLFASGVFFLCSMLYNYAMAVLTDPGLPPEAEEGTSPIVAPGDAEDAAFKRCSKCSRMKPPRTHHCRACDRCVLKMDHHCPWINNCVGYYNYRYFCLFMLYLAACCIFVILSSLDMSINAAFFSARSPLAAWERPLVWLSWLSCFITLVFLSFIGGAHIHLVVTNQTSIEAKENAPAREKIKFQHDYARMRLEDTSKFFFRSEFDLGFSENVQEVFGEGSDCCLTCCLPPLATPPRGNGFEFPHAPEGDSGDEFAFGVIMFTQLFAWIFLVAVCLQRAWRQLWNASAEHVL